MVALALSHAVALAVAAQPPGPAVAPVLATPAAREISFGHVAGRVGPGVDRVSVLVDGETLEEATVSGRRFAIDVALPARDVRVRVVAEDVWGRRAGTTVAPVFGLPRAAAPTTTRPYEDDELARRLESLVDDFPGTSAFYVQDLATGAGAAWNAKARFPAASTVKVAIAIEVLRRLDDPPSPRSSLHALLQAMLVDSDNDAANELLSWLGGSVVGGAGAVNALMESLGLGDSHLYGGFLSTGARPPIPLTVESSPVLEIEKYTTAWDLAELHRLLHLASGELGALVELDGSFTAADARYVLFTLVHSSDHGKLDRYIGDGLAVVPHKAGWISDSRHDAGLVYTPDGVFVAVVMTWNAGGVGDPSDVLAGKVAETALERLRELRSAASATPLPSVSLPL